MTFRPINSKIYDRIRIDNEQIIDTIEIVGETVCKSQVLTGMCEKKCLGNVWIDGYGKKYCPHPEGVAWIRKKI